VPSLPSGTPSAYSSFPPRPLRSTPGRLPACRSWGRVGNERRLRTLPQRPARRPNTPLAPTVGTQKLKRAMTVTPPLDGVLNVPLHAAHAVATIRWRPRAPHAVGLLSMALLVANHYTPNPIPKYSTSTIQMWHPCPSVITSHLNSNKPEGLSLLVTA